MRYRVVPSTGKLRGCSNKADTLAGALYFARSDIRSERSIPTLWTLVEIWLVDDNDALVSRILTLSWEL